MCKLSSLHFEKPDTETFSLLATAIDAIKRGGALPAVLNAANEVAVAAFLKQNLSFCGIMDVVEHVVSDLSHASEAHSLKNILEYDRNARIMTEKLISSRCN